MRPSLRCFFFLFALLLLTPPLAAHADNPTPPPTASELYKRAIGHLKEGLWFESAIADLTQAVKLDPANSDYHLALGCAEVDRAGSLAYAAWMTDLMLNAQAQYPKDLAAWQNAQKDPKSDASGDPMPVAPPEMRFQVKDDLHFLRLTGKQAAARAIALGTAAQAEWQQAVLLAPTRQARAQAENVQGWGMQYERRMLKYAEYPEAKAPGAPKPADVVAAFQAATKDDPKQAAYWEGLGDAYPFGELELNTDDPDTGHATEITQAWQKSLALAPGNTALRFRLYQVQSRHRYTGPKPDPKIALETLKAVAAYDPGNSFLQYSLAALLFQQNHYSDVHDRVNPATVDADTPPTKAQTDAWRSKVTQELAAADDETAEQTAGEAIDAIEAGNAGDHFTIPGYAPPVPRLLQRAWDYWDTIAHIMSDNFTYSAQLRELARAAGGYSLVAAQRGDEDGAARAARACIGIGLKMAGDWPVRDETPFDGTIMRALVGIAVASIGYSDLQHVYEQTGNAPAAQQAAAEYAALKERKTAYAAAIAQAAAADQATADAYFLNNY